MIKIVVHGKSANQTIHMLIIRSFCVTVRMMVVLETGNGTLSRYAEV